MAKYSVAEKYKDACVWAKAPEDGRKDGGKFDLKNCSQADLKYLHDVVKHPGVVKEESKSSGGS